jgi:signal transduction histidine kinase
MHAPIRSSLAIRGIAIAVLCIAALALHGAVRGYERPIPGLLVTPDGIVSSIGTPGWDGIRQGLRFPDRVVAIDGIDLQGGHGEYRSSTWDRAVEAAAREGRERVSVVVDTEGTLRRYDLRLERLDAVSWWLYGGGMILLGALYAVAALTALRASPHGSLSRTFAKFALVGALFFFTFFDAHTTRLLVPAFVLAFAWGPFTLAALALRLPDDVALLRRFPWLVGLLDLLGIGLAVAMITREATGDSATSLFSLCTALFGGAMVFFAAVSAIRFAKASGARRDIMRVLFRAMVPPYALVGVGVLATMLSARGSTAAFFAIPALALAPMATGVAFARHDVWGSRALLSRVLTRAVAGVFACVVAICVGAAFAASVGVPFRGALIAAAAGALASTPLAYLATRAVERRFFPAAAQYKPTIEQLSDELTSVTGPDEVALAVERTVRRWLACEYVQFRAAGAEVRGNAKPPVANGELADDLAITASFGGRRLGSLVVGRKRGGALFTTDDVDLLRTIANQAALALAHAHSYAELEQRRQQQAAAWQTERVALVETVAAEIAHEVRYPINFFRSVFRRDPKDAKLDEEEIDIGCEEVERLERLVSGLRRMVGYRIERRTAAVADLSDRAEMLLRDALGARTLRVMVPGEAMLRCDPDQVTQVLVNLLANAIDATAAHGRLGIEWTAAPEGAELVVWDDGPGFDGDASRLFAPWFTTKIRGTGLGLAITQRIVRAHGWSIDAVRAEARTRFVVSIPASDVVGVERKTPTGTDGLRPPVQGDEHNEESHRR